jgi:HEAT repeat protein
MPQKRNAFLLSICIFVLILGTFNLSTAHQSLQSLASYPEVVEPLLVLLQDDDPDARSVAARALGNTY